MMGDLEHLHFRERARCEQRLLHATLGITREHHVERAATECEDYAGVVRRKVAGGIGQRPEHLDGRPSHAPPVTRHKLPHRTVRTVP